VQERSSKLSTRILTQFMPSYSLCSYPWKYPTLGYAWGTSQSISHTKRHIHRCKGSKVSDN